jgi:hypothetical protein
MPPRVALDRRQFLKAASGALLSLGLLRLARAGDRRHGRHMAL